MENFDLNLFKENQRGTEDFYNFKLNENKKIKHNNDKQKFIVKSNAINLNYNSLNTIKNEYTKNFNFNNYNDIIQSSLEYNNYLIHNIVENRNSLLPEEMGLCMNILWSNIKKLAHNADNSIFTNKSLNKNTKFFEIYSDVNLCKNKNSGKTKKINKESGLLIVINKNILDKF